MKVWLNIQLTPHSYTHDAAAFFQDTTNLYIKLPTLAELDGIGMHLQDLADPKILDRYKVILNIDGFILKSQHPEPCW